MFEFLENEFINKNNFESNSQYSFVYEEFGNMKMNQELLFVISGIFISSESGHNSSKLIVYPIIQDNGLKFQFVNLDIKPPENCLVIFRTNKSLIDLKKKFNEILNQYPDTIEYDIIKYINSQMKLKEI